MRRVGLPPGEAEAMRLLILNADDFGLSPGVNQGILEAHRQGLVTSTTVIAIAPYAPEAAAASTDCPGLGFGVHLCLTQGRPLLPALLAPLLDERGLLRRPRRRPAQPYPAALRRHFAAVTFAALVAELGAQVAQARALGLPVTHLDTHHHLECDPRLARAVAVVAGRCRLPARAASARARRVLGALGVVTTDHFLPGAFGRQCGPSLRRRLARLPLGVTEINCHPGYPDPPLRLVSSYLEGRRQELAALTDPALPALLRRHHVRLLHFADLVAGTQGGMSNPLGAG